MYRGRSSAFLQYTIRIGLVAVLVAGSWFLAARFYPFTHRVETALMPPDGTTGICTTEKLLLHLKVDNPDEKRLRGNVHLELRTPDGYLLADRDKKVDVTNKSADVYFEMDAPHLPLEQVTLHWTFLNQKFAVPLKRILTVKPHETTLAADTEYLAESGAALRCGVYGVKSMFETVPIPGAEVQIDLRAGSNKVFPLYKGQTNDRSWNHAEFKIPAVAPGLYTLMVATRSDLGADKLEHPVRIKTRTRRGEQPVEKTVAVKPGSPPGWKINLTADKLFYLPKETIHAEIQTSDSSGKPIAGGNVEVTAAFDTPLRTFQTWKGKTDERGRAQCSIKLADFFAGKPLEKGSPAVRLEVTVTEGAGHSETVSRSFPVSNQAMRLIVVPEGGRLVPELDNRVYVAAVYPGGSPAPCKLVVRRGRKPGGQLIAAMETNALGLAEFHFSPFASHFRNGPLEKPDRKILGGEDPPVMLPKRTYDLMLEARDSKGNTAQQFLEMAGECCDDNILLHLDKALYQAGESIQGEVLGTADVPTVFLDVCRNGQTVRTRWLELKLGKAPIDLDLPSDLFGAVEIHASHLLFNGEFVHDSRLIYVQRGTALNSEAKPGHKDSPGPEKVYSTLQQELLKPQGQSDHQPAQSIMDCFRDLAITAKNQQLARVLLASARVQLPNRWDIAPVAARVQRVESQIRKIVRGLVQYALQEMPFMVNERGSKRWVFKPGLLHDMVTAQYIDASLLTGPFDEPLTLDEFARFDPDFKLERIAELVTYVRMQQIIGAISEYSNARQEDFLKSGKWSFPSTIIEDAARQQKLDAKSLKDAWGEPIRLRKRQPRQENVTELPQFDDFDLVSNGPDRLFDTADDLYFSDPNFKLRLRGNLFRGITASPSSQSSSGGIPNLFENGGVQDKRLPGNGFQPEKGN